MKKHSEFCSWKLNKCNGNNEGNTMVISEMHMSEFLLNESYAHDNLGTYSLYNNFHFGSLKK